MQQPGVAGDGDLEAARPDAAAKVHVVASDGQGLVEAAQRVEQVAAQEQAGRRRGRLAIGLSIGLLAFVLTWMTGHPMLNLSNQLWFACVLAVGLTAIAPPVRVGPVKQPDDP